MGRPTNLNWGFLFFFSHGRQKCETRDFDAEMLSEFSNEGQCAQVKYEWCGIIEELRSQDPKQISAW